MPNHFQIGVVGFKMKIYKVCFRFVCHDNSRINQQTNQQKTVEVERGAKPFSPLIFEAI